MIPSPGRMIRTDISRSGRFAELTPPAAVLFALLIPHFNAHGKMQAEPYTVKGTVCPKVPYIVTELPYRPDEIEQIQAKYGITPRLVTDLLEEITEKTNVKWFLAPDGLRYLHSLNYAEHQKLIKRKGEDRLPSFTGEEVADLSDTTPGGIKSRTCTGGVAPEVEVEVEVEGEVEGEEGRREKGAATVQSDLAKAPLLRGAPGQVRTKGGTETKIGTEKIDPAYLDPTDPDDQKIIGQAKTLNLPVSKKTPRATLQTLIAAKTPVDFSNPTHYAMVKTLDNAGVNTDHLESLAQLQIAYEQHRTQQVGG